jgi:PIN domain nuclease of toxin-antitoxin system
MGAVVSDTHSLIWYLFEPRLLSPAARNAFRGAEVEPGVIYVPTICLVEIRYLIDKRVISETVFTELLLRLRDNQSAPTAISLTIEIASSLQNLPRDEVPDMPDRIIAATALHLQLPLITRDRKIRASSIQSIW